MGSKILAQPRNGMLSRFLALNTVMPSTHALGKSTLPKHFLTFKLKIYKSIPPVHGESTCHISTHSPSVVVQTSVDVCPSIGI